MSAAVDSERQSTRHATGLVRRLAAMNHRDVGTMYLLLSLLMLFFGGAMALLVRMELLEPGMQYLDPHQFNQMTTMHALVMIFGMIMPAFAGLASRMIPPMIGARDMAMPSLNACSLGLLVLAVGLLAATLWLPGGAPAAGWAMHPLLVLQMGAAFPFLIAVVGLIVLSSVFVAVNVLATTLTRRAPDLPLLAMPPFVWAWLVTSGLLLVAMPMLGVGGLMLLADQFLGTRFFAPAGGEALLPLRQVFWFFDHPEIYIVTLPAFGIISEIIPAFSRKPLFGYRGMVWAMIAIGVLSLLAWAHPLLTSGTPLAGRLLSMLTTASVAVPVAVAILGWTATMWRGALTFETPMLFALGFLFMFTLGGFSGLLLAVVPVNLQYEDSYFAVAHSHYLLVSGALFAAFGGVYYWLPKWTGRLYDERLGRLHFWLTVGATNLTFFPQHFLGLAGMPRRIPDYAAALADFNLVSSIGAFVLGAAQLLFVCAVASALRSSAPPARAWEGARGPEWAADTEFADRG